MWNRATPNPIFTISGRAQYNYAFKSLDYTKRIDVSPRKKNIAPFSRAQRRFSL
jgi:hypothetical protein